MWHNRAWEQGGWELSGISGKAEELVLGPAEALLFSEPELLDRLRNATLVQACAHLAFSVMALQQALRGPTACVFCSAFQGMQETSSPCQ